MIKTSPSEITPEHVYISRRKFMVGIGALVTSSLVLSACGGVPSPAPSEVEGLSKDRQEPSPTPTSPEPSPESPVLPTLGATTDELGDKLTSHEVIIQYNNYYEFTTNKERVAFLARDFKTSPWKVEVVYGHPLGGLSLGNTTQRGRADVRSQICAL